MYINSSAVKNDKIIESESQEVLSKIDSVPVKNEIEQAE